MTCVSFFNPFDKAKYQESLDKPFLISTSIMAVVGLAVAIIGGLALVGVYYPNVNMLSTLAVMGKPCAIAMLAVGSAVAGIAIAICCLRKTDQMYKDPLEQKAFKNLCGSMFTEETLALVYNHNFSKFLYIVHVMPKNGKMEYLFYPPTTALSSFSNVMPHKTVFLPP